jgi:hypothetical protein
MPSEGDKQVRLSFVIDQPSVQRARQAMSDLIADATKLAEVLKRTNLGGIGQGLGDLSSGGSVGGAKNPQQVLAQNANAGPGQRVTNSLTDSGRLIKSFAQGSAESLRDMTQALQTAARDQERILDGLSRKYEAVSRARDSAFDLSGSSASGGAYGYTAGGGVMSTTGDPGTYVYATDRKGGGNGLDSKDCCERIVDKLDEVIAAIRQGGGGGGGRGGAANDDQEVSGGPGGGGLSIPKQARQAIKFGAAIKGAQYLLDYAAAPFEDLANMYNVRGQKSAQHGGIFGDYLQRAIAGDWTLGAQMRAAGGAFSTTAGQGTPGQQWSQAASDNAGVQSSNNAWNQASVFLKNSAANIGSVLSGHVIGKLQNASYQDQDVRDKQLAQYKENMDNYAKGEGAMNMALTGRFQQNVAGNRALSDILGYAGHAAGVVQDYSLGISRNAGIGDVLNGATGAQYVDPLAELRLKLAHVDDNKRAFYSAEEYAAAVAPLSQGLGRRALGVGGNRGLADLVMGGNVGGYAGIGNIAATAGVGGEGSQFVQGIYGMGNGGMSQAAAMGIGQAIASSITGGGMGSTGLGMMAAIQAGFGRGSGGGEDLLMAQQAQGGIGAVGSFLGGGIDAYHAAMNFQTAGQSFGKVGFANQGALSRIFGENPDLAADIVSGKKPIPEYLRAMGVKSKDDVEKFVRGTLGKEITLASRYVKGNQADASTLRAIASEAGGDIGKYAKMHNIDPKSAAGQKLRDDVAAGLVASGQVKDIAAGQGAAGIALGLGATDIRKGGAGRVAGSAEDLALKEQAKSDANLNKQTREQMTSILQNVALSAQAVQTFGPIVTNMTADAKELDSSLKLLTISFLQAAGKFDPNMKRRADAELKKWDEGHAQGNAKPPDNDNSIRPSDYVK